MIYDLRQEKDVERLNKRISTMLQKKALVELTDVNVRSLSQNKYLHFIFRYLSNETGEDVEFIKQSLYKIEANRELYMVEYKVSGLNKTVRYIRSSKSLTKNEMSASIERFRDFVSLNYGIYIPAPDEDELLRSLLSEASNYGYIKINEHGEETS